MSYLHRIIREEIRAAGLWNHTVDGLHLDLFIREEAAGDVDGVNCNFFLTYLPDPRYPVTVRIRGIQRREGQRYELSGRGRHLLTYEAPRSDGDEDDGPPWVEYVRFLDLEGVTAEADAILPFFAGENAAPWRPPVVMNDDAEAAKAIGII